MKNARPSASGIFWKSFAAICVLYLVINYCYEVTATTIRNPHFADFATYYEFSGRLAHGEDIYYDRELKQIKEKFEQETGLPITGMAEYSPLFFVIVRPLTWASYKTAILIWLVLNHVALVIGIFIMIKLYQGHVSTTRQIITYVTTACISSPMLRNMLMGQSNILILFCLILFLWFYQKEDYILAGVFLMLPTILKPQFGLLIFLLLIFRKYIALLAYLIGYVIINIVEVVIIGFDVKLSYFMHLFSAVEPRSTLYNLSIWSMGMRFLHPIGVYPLRHIVTIIVLVLTLAWVFHILIRQRSKCMSQVPLALSLILTTALLISPLTSPQHLSLMFLPLSVIWNRIDEHVSLPVLIGFVGSFLLISLDYSPKYVTALFFSGGVWNSLYDGKVVGMFWALYVMSTLPRGETLSRT